MDKPNIKELTDMKPQIIVNNLCKVYRTPEREPGLKAAVRSLFHRRYRDVSAVEQLNFTVHSGEILGFIGPNGAGKTTILKVLSGLLYPTSGEVRVAGFIPWNRKPEFLQKISMVMGNRHQLTWENTVMDSFYVLGEIYQVPRHEFQHTLGELVALLEIEPLLPKMARNLSLGERMKCELVAALLHRPRVLFLDEPTLGLDVTMQLRLRRFIAEYNRQSGATIILTSHYMADVVSLCPRVMLISEGRLLFDGELAQLAGQIAPFKLIRIAIDKNGRGCSLKDVLSNFNPSVTIIAQQDCRYMLRVRKADVAPVTVRLLSDISLVDMTIEDPPIEAVIDQVYREGVSL
jgi:ABC-2 type transport system ATP-binding protein